MGKGSKDLSSLQTCRAQAVQPHSVSLMSGRIWPVFQEYSQPVWRTAGKSSWQEAVSQHLFLLPRSKITWAQCLCSVLRHITPTMNYADVRSTLLPWGFHSTSSNSDSLHWRSVEKREGRDNESFLILSLGHMGSNKAPNSVLSVIQKCCMFHWALEACKQHTAHTGKNWPGKVAGGGEELDSFNSICVFNIAWMLFVHVRQCTSGTHNKSLSLHWEK